MAEEKGLTFETHIPPDLHVRADRSRMRQVLADNAVKFTPSGGHILLRATAVDRPPTDGTHATPEVCIEVQDDGIGIGAEELPRIWDRLYRGDRSRSVPGLGLGLSLVRAIVEAHHGRVETESRFGEGSVFRVYLPAASGGPNVGTSRIV